MSRQRVELLLNRTVENLGIVGDVVKVKSGFARNYLLPHRIGEHPTAEKIESLKAARAVAQAELAKLRSEREALIARMEAVTIKLTRSCNDQGVLYGAVSQRDISDQLVADGYGVDTRAVRLMSPIRRVGTYHCLIQFDRELRVEINIEVIPDRAIESLTQTHATPEPEQAPDAGTETGDQTGAVAESKASSGPKGYADDRPKSKSKGKKDDSFDGKPKAKGGGKRGKVE